MKLAGALAAAMLLTGCAGALVPGGIDSAGDGARNAPRLPSTIPGEATAPLNVRQPVAATPIAAAPAAAAPATAISAVAAGIMPGPAIASLPLSEESATRARAAFAISCASLQRRADATGLTRGNDWAPACADVARGGSAREYFARHFEAVQVADGKAFATGYYEPEIAGSRTRRAG